MLIINGINFNEADSEKYWSFPASFKGNKKETTINMIYSGEYYGARKVDGAYYRFIKDMEGNMVLQGRNRSVSGKYLNKIEWVPHLMEFFDALPNGTCLLGEIYMEGNEGSNKVTTIMGCTKDKAISRQETGQKLSYYVFDIWAIRGKSFMKVKAVDRFNFLENLNICYGEYPNVSFAQYVNGQELWAMTQQMLAEGYEGSVITRGDSFPEPGKRTARKTLKIKKELQETIDVIIIGANAPTRLYGGKEIETWQYWENTVTHEFLKGEYYYEYGAGEALEPITKAYYMNMAGSLKLGLLTEDGKVEHIGNLSGLTEEVLLNWRDYLGKVCEITGMEIMSTGGIRHPKFVAWRPDKTQKECKIEQLYG